MEREFAHWARVLNERAGWERVKIFPDWQVLQGDSPPAVGEVNLIYLKFDWRLDFPRIARDYAGPLLDFLAARWPGAEVHFVGHSLGGTVGRYVACRYPRRLDLTGDGRRPALWTLRGGAAEQRRPDHLWRGRGKGAGPGTRPLGGGTYLLRLTYHPPESGLPRFRGRVYQPVHPRRIWMDPRSGLLADGFGSLARLEGAVPQAVALYGLGKGSYDLRGDYHPEIYGGKGVGPGLGPDGGPPEYALSGDGRVDPVSARGPFVKTFVSARSCPTGI